MGTLKLEGYDQRLLVHGDRVLAIASRGLAHIDLECGMYSLDRDAKPVASLAVLPLTTFGRTPFDGAVGVRVADELSVAGRIEHHSAERDADASIDRSLVVGDRLYTVSYLGAGGQPAGHAAARRASWRSDRP